MTNLLIKQFSILKISKNIVIHTWVQLLLLQPLLHRFHHHYPDPPDLLHPRTNTGQRAPSFSLKNNVTFFLPLSYINQISECRPPPNKVISIDRKPCKNFNTRSKI